LIIRCRHQKWAKGCLMKKDFAIFSIPHKIMLKKHVSLFL